MTTSPPPAGRHTKRRWRPNTNHFRRVGVAATVAMVIAGCVGSEGDSTPGPVECREVVGRSFGPRTTCRLVSVPMDHDHPDGAMLELAVVATPGATQVGFNDDDVGAVVFLAGGPGQAATDFVEQMDGLPFPIVFVDQRGTGHSSPVLDCPEVDDLLAARLLEPSAEARQMETDALVACAQRLVDDDVDLSLFTTQQSADDLDVVRQDLGLDRWNLWGGSYGAELAVEAMRRHPDSIRSAVVDSALPDFVDVLATWPDVRREKLDTLFDACASNRACSDRYGDLESLLDDVLRDLDRDPRVVDVRVGQSSYSVLMDDDRALLAVLAALNDTNAIPRLPALLAAAADGRLDDLAPFAVADGTTSFAEALHWSNRCVDGWAASDQSAAQRAVADETGAYLDVFSTGWIVDRCNQLPIEIDAGPEHDHSPVEVPALVMVGRFDPNQSTDWAARLADELGNATWLSVNWMGHTVGYTPCGRRTVESFFADPASPIIACDTGRNVRWSSTTR